MIRETSSNQEPLSQFGWPFQNALDPQNRWVRLAHCVPWDALSEAYLRKMNPRQGRPSIKARANNKPDTHTKVVKKVSHLTM